MSGKGIQISRGLLKLSLRYFLSCGSWEINVNDYTFRFQNNQFVLIGYDSFSIHRSSGEIEESSYNFLTKRKVSLKEKMSFSLKKAKPRLNGLKSMLKMN